MGESNEEPKYISFGPVMNEDGTPTEFTKRMFGEHNARVRTDEFSFETVKKHCEQHGHVCAIAELEPDWYVVLVERSHPTFPNKPFVTWGFGYAGLVWGHYDLDKARGWSDFVNRIGVDDLPKEAE